MADPMKIQVGDRLRLDAEIVKIGNAYEVHLKGDHSAALLFLSRPIIEAAEHIPAPKTFKRGDWVRHTACDPDDDCPLGPGIVLRTLPGGRIAVDFDGSDSVDGHGGPAKVRAEFPNDLMIIEAPDA